MCGSCRDKNNGHEIIEFKGIMPNESTLEKNLNELKKKIDLLKKELNKLKYTLEYVARNLEKIIN